MAKIFLVGTADLRQASVSAALEAAGHEVAHHSESIGAVAAISRAAPDLVVIEADRPVIDGAALCGLIRKTPKLSALPVLLLGKYDEGRGYAAASACGAQGTINREQSPQDAASQILVFLNRRRPLLPAGEAQRMQTLRSYRVLETTAEQPFDDLVKVASIVCQTPIALVSLVDEARQWFKARVGLDATETPREQAFCAHAIHGSEMLEVVDAAHDPRFANNPLVKGGPEIRFYAGAPLVGHNGHAAGTLCVIDRRPRVLTKEQREALVALGRVATHLLELRAVMARR